MNKISTHFPYLRSFLQLQQRAIFLFAFFIGGLSTHAQVGHVVISQVYGGGGNTGATFNRDFVELFNPTGNAVELTGWSLQYAGPANTTGFANNFNLSGTIQPGRYFLIHAASGGAVGANLPAADLVSTINLGTAGGKVALVNNTTAISGTGCPQPPNVVDFLGYGTANCAEGTTSAAHSNTTSTRRTNSCIDTNNNSADFSTANPPAPRNSSTAPLYCYPVQLVITNITPASPEAGEGFSVTIEARNAAGNPQGVLMNTTVELTTNGNAGAISGTTTGVIAAGTSVVTLSGVMLASGGNNVTLTATRIAGQNLLAPGTSAPFTVIGGSDTSVQFSVATSTVNENAGTVEITLVITNPSPTEATSVLVAVTSGNSDAVGGFTSEIVTFPAGSSAPQVITLTVVDNNDCAGNTVVSFGLENVMGGMGDAGVGSPSSHMLTILDDDQATGVQLTRQYFGGTGSDNWTIAAGGANVSTNIGIGDTPPNQRILTAPASWQVSNQLATLELAPIFPNEWTDMTIRARVASLSATTGNGAEVSDQVRFFVNINGAGFPATPDLTITGNNNARWGFATGTGVASTTAGTPVTFTPTGGGNLTAQGFSYVEIAIPDGAQSIALRVVAVNNDNNEIWAIDNIEIVGTSCPSTYYSEANGNMNDPIWSNFPGGAPGPALINEAANVVIQNGFTVTNSTNTNVNELTVQAGGTLLLTDNFALAVHGNVVQLDGEVSTNEGTLALVGNGETSLSASVPQDLFDITVNTVNGTVATGTIGVRGTLQLVQGIFDATGADIILVSNADGTGRLGEVPMGANYVGVMTVQRYVPGGATNWRLLGSPVAGATIQQWMDDFLTAGFPGSHHPDFFDPINSGIYWPSIRYYDETVPGADPNDGVVGVESSQTVLEAGRGYAAWSGDTLDTTEPFLIDVTGAPHIAQTPIGLPLTYTDSGNPDVDGLNLVSNPLPSAIAFGAIERGADVQNAYYIFDPATGNNLAWTNGIGQGSANGVLQSSQGFWMKADGPAATASVDESAKVNDLQGGAFGGLELPNVPMVRLTVSSEINTYSDESLIVFDLGTPEVDPADMLKFVFAHPAAPQIATRSADGRNMQIDHYGTYSTDISIPVTVQVAVSGTYEISAALLAMSGLSCISIEDLQTGVVTPLNDGTTHTFEIDAADDWDTPRFLLHASAPIPFTTTDVVCSGEANGTAQLQIADGPLNVIWADAFGNPIEEMDNASGTVNWEDLEAGAYMVTVEGTGTSCGNLVEEFTIDSPFILEVELIDALHASCGTENGYIAVSAMGGTAPYEYLYSDGTTDESIEAAPGTYVLEVTDANGCLWTSEAFLIGLDETAPVAAFSIEGTVEVNEPVPFTNTSANAGSYFWTFGDGGTSEEADPVHTYELPGIYTVTLSISTESCTDVHSEDITVVLGTSIGPAITVQPNKAWVQGDQIIFEHSYNTGKAVVIEVLDATGRIHIEQQAAGTPGRVTIPANMLPTGIWFVRVSNNGEQETHRVPLVR